MKMILVFLTLLLLVLSSACFKTDSIDSERKQIQAVENYVFVKGRWKKTEGTSSSHSPARMNTVSIICDKNALTCKEIIAEVVTPQDDSFFKTKQLFIHEMTYRIVDWSNEIIIAKYAAPVADLDLRISIKDGIAEKHWRETKARGSDTANPNIYTNLILE